MGGKKNREIDIVVSLPRGRILIEVKYRNDPTLEISDAIVEQANDPETLGAIVVTKTAGDFGVVPFPTRIPIVKIPAFAFLYLLGHAERISRAETRSPLE
ncbi:MAG TPA: hypothetical protein VMW83_04705 [Spirochaetia bacterium]|nr:hypothetical protein [Spirochaetia bacterium]